LLTSGGGEAIGANSTFRVRQLPFGLHPTFHEQLLEGRVQGTFFDAKDVARELPDALGDGIAMERASLQDA
jgi:hypothetical protein